MYLKGDHVFTHRRKNIARSFRACNFLIITRQIFTDRLFLYRVKECSSKVSFLFITFIPECISRFRRIYNIYICDYRLRHVRIIIRFFFPMKSVSRWIISIPGRSITEGVDRRAARWQLSWRSRWSATSWTRLKVSIFSEIGFRSLLHSSGVVKISLSHRVQFSRAITNYSPSSSRGKIAFQPLFESGFHRAADPIKGGTEKERSSIDCYCCVTGPNAITVRRLTANLLIYVAWKSLISV